MFGAYRYILRYRQSLSEAKSPSVRISFCERIRKFHGSKSIVILGLIKPLLTLPLLKLLTLLAPSLLLALGPFWLLTLSVILLLSLLRLWLLLLLLLLLLMLTFVLIKFSITVPSFI